jgi:hypothetical protein
MIRRLILFLVVANLLAVGYWGFRYYRVEAARRAEIAKIGAKWEQFGWMTQLDYIQLREVARRIGGHTPSDSDVNWLLEGLSKYSRAIPRARIAGVLQSVSRLSPQQEQRVLASTRTLLNDRDPLVRMYGVTLQSVVRDPAAIPPLLPLLDDSDKHVKRAAQKALQGFGFPHAGAKGPT